MIPEHNDFLEATCKWRGVSTLACGLPKLDARRWRNSAPLNTRH